MKKFAGSILILLGGVLIHPQDAQAGPFGIAGRYNVFVFGDIAQVHTDVEGRVAGGGNVTYGAPDPDGFSIASKITAGSGPAELVAGNNVILTNGSVGQLPTPKDGTIYYGGTQTIVNVDHGLLVNGSVIDFPSEQSYLTSQSGYWGSLTPNGTSNVLGNGNIELTGTDAALNIFLLQASDITQNISFSFFAPVQSTLLVNVSGATATLKNFGFFYCPAPSSCIPGGDPSDDPIAGESDHTAGYPYNKILFNFPTATLLDIDAIAIDGSILAPLAHVNFGLESGAHIDGQLIADSLSGPGEAHDVPFDGQIPVVPEPATFVLLVSGLGGMAALRRRRQPLARGPRRVQESPKDLEA